MKTHIIGLAVATIALSACQQGPGGGTFLGAGAGAAAGAGIGLLTADSSDAVDMRQRALIGAGIGALAGGAVGYFLDQQEEELTQDLQGTGAQVTREGETLKVTMPDVSFRTGSADIDPAFYGPLNSVAGTLKQYNQSYINIYGHTDSVGDDAFNQRLSEQRALSVRQYLIGQGVNPDRIIAQGFGETRPVATNDTPQGRAANRRVEIAIIPIT